MRGVSVYRDVSPGLETSRRADRGSRGRTTLMFEDSFLDAEALDYALGFETNELVLARHPVHNTWWPVRANTLYAWLVAVRPISGSRRFARRACLLCNTMPSKQQRRSLCCLSRSAAPDLLLLTSRYLASNSDMENSVDVLQGIILDPGTEAPEHVLRGRERGRPLCVMFYGPGQVSSNPKRYDSARLASPHCS